MKAIYKTLIVLLFGLGISSIWANNIQVSNIALVNQNTTAGLNNVANHTTVQFDLTWDNSWRNSAGPSNWDAAWVFVKFQVFGSPSWEHATLSSTDAHHTITNNNGVTMNIDAAANGRGVMIHRTSNGNGTVNLQGVGLRWTYRSGNVVHDTANVTVRVFAIEMVFIPEGQFFIGDGTLTTPLPSNNAFKINNVGNNRPYRVISEGALSFINNTISGGGVDQLYNNRWTAGYTLPAAFPKGFASIYVMKYELTVQQYVDFFNTLRTDITTAKNNRNIQSSQPSRSTFAWNSSPLTDATSGVGANRPQGGFNNDDILAYGDWSGLRIMTELEFEKINRGSDRTGASPGIAVYPVNGEYSWGENANLSSVTSTTHLVNDGLVNEGIASAQPNMNVNTGLSSGPLRVGIFAAKNATSLQRRQSGASYYGVMELTGNIEDPVIPAEPGYDWCTSSTQRFYEGIHGDGNIDSNTGNNTTLTYTGVSNFSKLWVISTKGGSYSAAERVSERITQYPGSTSWCGNAPMDFGRKAQRGFRGAVSANQF